MPKRKKMLINAPKTATTDLSQALDISFARILDSNVNIIKSSLPKKGNYSDKRDGYLTKGAALV